MKSFIDFSNKTFLITGATSGIGFEICNQINIHNGSVIVLARDEQKIDELKNNLLYKEKFKGIICDLENIESVQQIVDQIPHPVDGIIHSAGIVKLLPIKFYNQETQESIRKINYDSIVNIVSKMLKSKKINSESSLVFISSIAGNFGMKGNLMYSSSKASLDIFAKVLASEVASLKIRVNTICPGQVETPLTVAVSEKVSAEAIELDKKKYPLGYGKPIDVANLALFLLSEKSKWITGLNIPIDGGRTTILN